MVQKTPHWPIPYETHLQGIMVVVFTKTNIQFKMMNTNTMIPCIHASQRGNCPLARVKCSVSSVITVQSQK